MNKHARARRHDCLRGRMCLCACAAVECGARAGERASSCTHAGVGCTRAVGRVARPGRAVRQRGRRGRAGKCACMCACACSHARVAVK